MKIEYFRPRLKGRKIFGEKEVMYPHGTIWRTGANSGTKISFSDDVKVENIDVPKGEYLIFTWPGATEWTIALYKDLTIGGNTQKYDKSKEAAMIRMENPRLVPLAWYREAWEEQQEVLGSDPWAYGMTEANRRNLEMITQFLFEAGMTRELLNIDDCFLDASQGRKRGVEFRI